MLGSPMVERLEVPDLPPRSCCSTGRGSGWCYIEQTTRRRQPLGIAAVPTYLRSRKAEEMIQTKVGISI